MNNVGTLGLLMPVAITTGAKFKRSVAILLMPLSFGCILGGLITLIGTLPNIIVVAYRGTVTGNAFGMFDFSPVSGVFALVGVAFVALIGWRLVPDRLSGDGDEDFFQIENYLTEVCVPESSAAIGKTVREVEGMTPDADEQIVGIGRGAEPLFAPRWLEIIRAGDILLIEAGSEDLDIVLKAFDFELVDAQDGHKLLNDGEATQVFGGGGAPFGAGGPHRRRLGAAARRV